MGSGRTQGRSACDEHDSELYPVAQLSSPFSDLLDQRLVVFKSKEQDIYRRHKLRMLFDPYRGDETIWV